MPTYTYRCQECRQEFVTVQRITEPSLTVYPHLDEIGEPCSGEVERIIGGPVNFVLTGKGFHNTDYR